MAETSTQSRSIATQLDAMSPTIIASGWSSQSHIDRARISLMSYPAPVPAAGRSRLSQFLVDAKVLTREQAGELDTLAATQQNLPHFRILKKVGSGGMGIVYLATHTATGRECALKTLNVRLADDGDFVSRFQRETHALAGIKHANVAEVIESGECSGHFYLAMEYIDGPSLMTLLRDYKALPELYALRIARQVAEGLAHVYAQSGLIHRDIKPENVLILRSHSSGGMFPEDDVAKLIDFGLAKSTNEKDERLTQTGMTIGTPLYMSPEQVRGETLDCRSDIYGLGATLYHLLTGVTPFTGSSPGTIMSAHLTEPIPDPSQKVPSLNPLTRDLIGMAMAKDVDKRFLTYEALINACSEAITALAVSSHSAPQFLRKPLVLKTGVKKPLTDRHPTPDEDRSAESEPLNDDLKRDAISTRIRAKHRDLRDSAQATIPTPDRSETTVTRSASKVYEPAPVSAPANAPMLRAVTEQLPIKRKHLSPLPVLPPMQTPSSMVLDDEARRAVGTGVIPWALLGLSLAALAVYLIFLRN
ncbi:MAG: serine/threonine protein kinase [Planctomycetes bacterium]|nr:serine/threonine protein kinase [Planctomycetota bacterium]